MKSLLLSLQLYYLSFLDYLDERSSINRFPDQVIERKQENTKLMRGVRKMVARLRNMTPEARLAEENLLSKEVYKKTRYELRQELEARRKVINNPILITEDDLVNKVVKQAPTYVKHQELSELRKALTACLKLAGQNPKDTSYAVEAKRLKAKLSLLKGEIERMKNG
jgi:DNA-binding phage protein